MTHYLIVGVLDEETGLPEWDIEHDPDCPREELYVGEIFSWIEHTCPIGREIACDGLIALGAPSDKGWPEDLPKTPGKYAIEYWSETTHHYYFGEDTDSGIRFVEGLAQTEK